MDSIAGTHKAEKKQSLLLIDIWKTLPLNTVSVTPYRRLDCIFIKILCTFGARTLSDHATFTLNLKLN